jgi:hypothetical protein
MTVLPQASHWCASKPLSYRICNFERAGMVREFAAFLVATHGRTLTAGVRLAKHRFAYAKAKSPGPWELARG